MFEEGKTLHGNRLHYNPNKAAFWQVRSLLLKIYFKIEKDQIENAHDITFLKRYGNIATKNN